MNWSSSEITPLLKLSVMHVDNLCSVQPDRWISVSVSNRPSNPAIMVAALSIHTNNGLENVVDSARNARTKKLCVNCAVWDSLLSILIIDRGKVIHSQFWSSPNAIIPPYGNRYVCLADQKSTIPEIAHSGSCAIFWNNFWNWSFANFPCFKIERVTVCRDIVELHTLFAAWLDLAAKLAASHIMSHPTEMDTVGRDVISSTTVFCHAFASVGGVSFYFGDARTSINKL